MTLASVHEDAAVALGTIEPSDLSGEPLVLARDDLAVRRSGVRVRVEHDGGITLSLDAQDVIRAALIGLAQGIDNTEDDEAHAHLMESIEQIATLGRVMRKAEANGRLAQAELLRDEIDDLIDGIAHHFGGGLLRAQTTMDGHTTGAVVNTLMSALVPGRGERS